jgi:hypothetical protein
MSKKLNPLAFLALTPFYVKSVYCHREEQTSTKCNARLLSGIFVTDHCRILLVRFCVLLTSAVFCYQVNVPDDSNPNPFLDIFLILFSHPHVDLPSRLFPSGFQKKKKNCTLSRRSSFLTLAVQ